MPEQDPPRPGVPTRLRTEELSVPTPVIPPGPIFTLSPEEIARFFVRARRDQDTEHWDVRLDAALREILERANDFVPSESGGILLDDPRAKLAGSPAPRLTYIAAFGPGVENVVGKRIPSDRGIAGKVYKTGRPGPDRPPRAPTTRCWTSPRKSARCVRWSRVPIVVGESICGVLQLANRRSGGPYTPRDKELLRIFAAFMSSSIQNALDAIRARAQARIDDLTGLANSRYFHTRLAEEIARADREGTDLAMLFIDLDRFKEVNDRFGHLAGSWTLAEDRQAAGRKRAAGGAGGALRRRRVRRSSCRAPTRTGPRRPAETLRHTIADADAVRPRRPSTRHTPSPLPRITASLGVSSYRDHLAPGGTQRRRESTLLRLADSAMYRAKASGRNRVEVADPEGLGRDRYLR